VKELLTNYGPLGLIWFDTPGKMTKAQSMELVEMVRKYQPECLVSSRVGNGVGDYLDYGDGEIPAKKSDKVWEALFTHNDSWGYVDMDHNWKSTKEIVRMLSEINGKGGNFLLNVGPKGDGTLPRESVEVFRHTGEWISRNKEAVYATGYSPFQEFPWGTCTSKPGELYLQVHQWPQNSVLTIPGIRTSVKSANLLASGEKLRYKNGENELIIYLPERMPDPVNTVIRVTYAGELTVDSMQHISADFDNRLLTAHAEKAGQTTLKLYNYAEEFGDWKHAEVLESWTTDKDQATWNFYVDKAGEYRVSLDYSYPLDQPKRVGILRIAAQELTFETLLTGTRVQDFYKHDIGVISIPAPGKYSLAVKPANQGDQFIKLRGVSISAFE
jgi:alpha-L-fucosidase